MVTVAGLAVTARFIVCVRRRRTWNLVVLEFEVQKSGIVLGTRELLHLLLVGVKYISCRL
jgi:hypothetical protein